MAVMAQWGPMKFEISASALTPLTNFRTGFKIKNEETTDTSGTPPTNTTGCEGKVRRLAGSDRGRKRVLSRRKAVRCAEFPTGECGIIRLYPEQQRNHDTCCRCHYSDGICATDKKHDDIKYRNHDDEKCIYCNDFGHSIQQNGGACTGHNTKSGSHAAE